MAVLARFAQFGMLTRFAKLARLAGLPLRAELARVANLARRVKPGRRAKLAKECNSSKRKQGSQSLASGTFARADLLARCVSKNNADTHTTQERVDAQELHSAQTIKMDAVQCKGVPNATLTTVPRAVSWHEATDGLHVHTAIEECGS